jgi:hypothetical protein
MIRLEPGNSVTNLTGADESRSSHRPNLQQMSSPTDPYPRIYLYLLLTLRPNLLLT